MANSKDLNEIVDEDVTDIPELPEDEATSEAESEEHSEGNNEDQEPHVCSKYGCRYFLLTIVFVYFGIIGMACFFMYLGRFSVLRGFDHVKKTFNSITFANLENVTGQDPV
jgi:hypothetical protein